MRFLLGLLAGAFVTILLASTTDAPTDAVVDGLRETWTNVIQKMTALDTPAESNLSRLKPAEKGIPRREDETELILEDPVAPMPEVPIAIHTPPSVAEPIEVALPEVPAPVTGTAPVWEPFHSEISATGFAKRLSLQLGYPFEVLKQGPARYLVVFDYASERERSLLQQQIAALTGYRHP